MTNYDVKGMSCAACQARVEKAVNSLDGVTQCNVSLLTNSMSVEGEVSPEEVCAAVKAAGYKAKPSSGSISFDDDSRTILRRLAVSAVFLLVLMYFSMGVMMLNLPVPAVISGSHLIHGIIELALSGIILWINRIFFIRGFTGLIHLNPNMDSLVALGSGVSFLWSLYVLIFRVESDLYFESAAMILVLITVGKYLESVSKGRTTDALKALMNLSPKTATVLRGDNEITVGIDEVKAGDICVVKAGEAFPVDGTVTEGRCAVDESSLTGESIPVDKGVGDTVSAATINRSGYVLVRADKIGNETVLSGIIKLISDAATTKAPIARIADRVSGVFVPVIIGIAAVTFVIWLLCGADIAFSLKRAISVLVISCPCALGLATPVAIMVGNGRAAREGILFKNSEALEITGRVKTVILDKTGTITRGEPSVTDIIPAAGHTDEELTGMAYALESHSTHPIAAAITKAAARTDIIEVEDLKILDGNGLECIYLGRRLTGGSLKYISGITDIPDDMRTKADDLASSGRTPVLFSCNGECIGMIAVADEVKKDSAKAIRALKKMGIRTVMLTGDNEITARAIAAEVGTDEIIAGVMPADKADNVLRYKELGRTVMIGDGINDAPALTIADVGMAIGAGTDIAIDAADVVLMKNSLMDAVSAIFISKKTLTNIHQNLFWAFIYNLICIPVAAGCFVHSFGIDLNPMLGAAAMSMSSFCVVMNALRLNLIKTRKD